MRKSGVFFVVALLALWPVAALPIDDTPAVKVTPLLKTTESWDGIPIVYPEGQAELTALMVEIAPGRNTGWHLHPVPSFAYLLEGSLEITLSDGRVKRLHAGEALAEVTHILHNGRAAGDGPARIVVFYAGAVGKALTVNQPPGAAPPP